jgi:hypothetical protein
MDSVSRKQKLPSGQRAEAAGRIQRPNIGVIIFYMFYAREATICFLLRVLYFCEIGHFAQLWVRIFVHNTEVLNACQNRGVYWWT